MHSLCSRAVFCLVGGVVMCGLAMGQEAPSADAPPARVEQQAPAPIERQAAPEPDQEVLPPPTVWSYDRAIFQKPFAPDQLNFLKQMDGMPTRQVLRDKQFHKLLGAILPTGMFHYGADRSIESALDMVMETSPTPMQIIDGRYAVISGHNGPYLVGRGFIWIDMKDGVALGGFYFHPTNGEPTPSMVIFSRQIVKQDSIALGELPPEFGTFLRTWSSQSSISMITTRYFITGSNKRILLEHDEDYCASMDEMPAPDKDTCEQMDFEAADIDVTAADYLEQTNHATNATAWMIDGDQTAWLQVRESRCGMLLACRIRMTRERKEVILHRAPSRPPAHQPPPQPPRRR